MKIDRANTDTAISRELGGRLQRQRLARNIDQRALAEEAGIARTTLQRIEDGEPVNSTSLLRVLRVLDLVEGLEQLIPEPRESPIEQLEARQRARPRQRAGTPRRRRAPEPPA